MSDNVHELRTRLTDARDCGLKQLTPSMDKLAAVLKTPIAKRALADEEDFQLAALNLAIALRPYLPKPKFPRR